MLTAAPGQVLRFNIEAFDQTGTMEEAVWRLDDENEEEAVSI